LKQLRNLRDPKLADAIDNAIRNVEQAESPQGIKQIKKLKGHQTAYRIRCGDYGIGVFIANNTVLFATVLPRKDIYGKFP